MHVAGSHARATIRPRAAALLLPPAPPEPCTPAELRAFVHAGLPESDACELLLAQVARIEGALDLELGDGLAALCHGDRLISLGFSSLGDYAREILDLRERTAQAMAHLSRELRSRPLLREAVRRGEVRQRSALTVLPVAVGDAEAEWVERARTETVRALEAAVRAARRGAEDEEEWTRVQFRLSPEDRATVDEALAMAARMEPASARPQQLEAIAAEYLGEHAPGAADAGGVALAPEGASRERLERTMAALEAETERWSYLERVHPVEAGPAPGDVHEAETAAGIDARLRELAAKRRRWDAVLGYCAWAVKRSGLWRVAGFASFEHYCSERLGLAARTVEQRAALEKRLWESPALRAARDGGLAYEKLRLLARLPEREVEAWAARARRLTCVALRAALEAREERQMRAARALRARVPARVARTLQDAIRAVRAAEGCLLADGSCLVRMARHFVDTWKAHDRKARTLSQKVRARDLGCCQVPGCSRRATHAHHVHPRARGGTDDPENLVALCAFHHLRGIHGGYIRVRGLAPDRLVWEVGGRIWSDGGFGGPEPSALAA